MCDKRCSLIRILLKAMFLEGHKNGILSIESSPCMNPLGRWGKTSMFFSDGVIHGLDSIDDIPLLCVQKHAVYKMLN